MGKNRVIVIGIDGGTFDIIRPMVERGELPTIASFMREGAWGKLATTIPPVTVPAWVSCVTGMNPGKFGVFYFTGNSHLYNEEQIADVTKVHAKAIWHFLTDHQKKSIIFAVPFTYPPSVVDGVMVSSVRLDMGVRGLKSYPPELAEDLIKTFSLEEALREGRDLRGIQGKLTQKKIMDRHIGLSRIISEKVRDISLYLLRNNDWDFFMTVFKSTDWIQHRLLGYLDPNHPLYTPELSKSYGDLIYDEYRRVDLAIKDILKEAGEATVILLSDHGGGPFYGYFYTNVWLKQKGFLKIVGNRDRPSLRLTNIPVNKLLSSVGVRTRAFQHLSIPMIRRSARPISQEIDWRHTKAYATTFGININLKGREPEGVVPEDDYSELCELIREDLYKLEDGTGQRVIDKVYRREEIYSGPYVNEAPDIVYLFKDTHYLPIRLLYSSSLFEEMTLNTIGTGQHISCLLDGIFLMKGPFIKPGMELNGPHIMDIAPTVLYLMGLPVPKDMDGRVLTEVFREGFLDATPLIHTESGGLPEWDGKGITIEEENLIKNQLRQMGYIE